MSATARKRRRRRGVYLGLAAALSVGAALAACEQDRLGPPQRPGEAGTTSGGGDGLGLDDDGGGPPPPDAGGLCGNQSHQVIANAPNLYFVLDASGSMSAQTPRGSTRYERVRDAAVDLVRKLGPLINVGAAIFPKDADANVCSEGGEVFPVTPGEPDVEGEMDGPTTAAFRMKTKATPFGGTPTAATLRTIAPKLAALPGKTIVLLATDGGPNCNPDASCSADECMANIEGLCAPDVNCCAPGGATGPEDCLDRADTIDAVSAIAAQGVDVYVIGVPGSEIYGDVLDEMALAGGAPQFVSPFYYKVDNLDTLGDVLASIASVVVSCEFDLVDPPPEQGKTNVYLDTQLIPYDASNGWQWKAPAVVELRGEPCQQVKSGKVKQVQIVSGCPTEIPK